MNKNNDFVNILKTNGISVDIRRKAVKRLSLTIHPPDGRISVSVPRLLPQKDIEKFIISKIDWICRHRERILATANDLARPIVSGELRPVWGTDYPLLIKENYGQNLISLKSGKIVICFAGSASQKIGELILEALYKQETLKKALDMLPGWLKKLRLPPLDLKIRSMKSRWGSCRPETGSITLNSALAKRRPACLEYVLVHELGHFFVHNHGPQFKAFLTRHFPDWHRIEQILNPPLKSE